MMPKKSNFSHIPDPVGKMKKKGEKEYRRQQERAAVIRETDCRGVLVGETRTRD
jgi:hypothetical protein